MHGCTKLYYSNITVHMLGVIHALFNPAYSVTLLIAAGSCINYSSVMFKVGSVMFKVGSCELQYCRRKKCSVTASQCCRIVMENEVSCTAYIQTLPA